MTGDSIVLNALDANKAECAKLKAIGVPLIWAEDLPHPHLVYTTAALLNGKVEYARNQAKYIEFTIQGE